MFRGDYLQVYNQQQTEQEQMHLCLGLGFGKILRVGNNEVYGAEVNAACKLGEDAAKSGEILVTGAVKNACANMEGLSFSKLESAPPGADSAYLVMLS